MNDKNHELDHGTDHEFEPRRKKRARLEKSFGNDYIYWKRNHIRMIKL